MCTYQTTTLPVAGSGKGAQGWFRLSDASVYFDHPVHASAEHTVNIDLRNPALGAGARVALELDPAAARALAEAILGTLETIPPALLDTGPRGRPVDHPAAKVNLRHDDQVCARSLRTGTRSGDPQVTDRE